ncbi:MAG: NYN domain-containing protein [bacterium]
MHRGPQAVAHSGIGGIVHAPNAALLIDFDNVTMGIRSDLGQELRNLLGSDIIKGKVAVQRAYADWRRYPQYIVPLAESSIDMIMAPAYGSAKKNATDIRLAIDAMELVFTRPEIGTFILLSGDSDFSSLVMKIKEYGKYVIGVGIRESSSDLLVQNCDEYYSYNALAGLVKAGEESNGQKRDPWELVIESIDRMVRNGDVMRSDRLKQVMQEIDSTFDEKDLNFSKFSKFCLEAAQKGLLIVNKLDNGQLEVAPAKGAKVVPAAASRDAAPAGEGAEAGEGREGREGRGGRRGRRGGRGRNRRDRDEAPMGTTAERAAATASEIAGQDGTAAQSEAVTGGAVTSAAPAAAPAAAPIAAPIAAPAAPQRGREPRHERQPRPDRQPQAAAAPRVTHAHHAADATIGTTGIRLTRDEAFALVKDAVTALVTGDDAVPSERVREKAFAILARDSESLSERNFARILRDAHDGNVVDLRKRGDAFEVALAANVPSVSDQLNEKEAALKAVADREKAANTPVVPRGMGPRSAPGRPGRGSPTKAVLPPDFLLIGVVDDSPAPAPKAAPAVEATPVATTRPAKETKAAKPAKPAKPAAKSVAKPAAKAKSAAKPAAKPAAKAKTAAKAAPKGKKG